MLGPRAWATSKTLTTKVPARAASMPCASGSPSIARRISGRAASAPASAPQLSLVVSWCMALLKREQHQPGGPIAWRPHAWRPYCGSLLDRGELAVNAVSLTRSGFISTTSRTAVSLRASRSLEEDGSWLCLACDRPVLCGIGKVPLPPPGPPGASPSGGVGHCSRRAGRQPALPGPPRWGPSGAAAAAGWSPAVTRPRGDACAVTTSDPGFPGVSHGFEVQGPDRQAPRATVATWHNKH